MQDVYVVTEDVRFFNFRVANVLSDIHSTLESVECDLKTYIIKDALIAGYHISSDELSGSCREMVMKKWFGIWKVIIKIKPTHLRENVDEISRDL